MQVTVSLTVEVSANVDVNEVGAAIVESGQQTMVEALKAVCGEYEDGVSRCPHCGNERIHTEGTYSRVLLTSFGKVSLSPRRILCEECDRRFLPIEPLLECLEGANVTGKLKEACVLAGSSWPYKTAARVLEQLCGTRVSPEKLRQITVVAGAREAELRTEAA